MSPSRRGLWNFFLLWRRVFVLNKRSPQRKDVTVFMSSKDDCVKWREGLFCIAKSIAANNISM